VQSIFDCKVVEAEQMEFLEQIAKDVPEEV
jgi:hypothetical protein